MNFDRLRVVADLANYGLQQEAMLTVSIPERRGQFVKFISSLYDEEGAVNVTEFKYRYSVSSDAKILLSISVKEKEDLQKVLPTFLRCLLSDINHHLRVQYEN